MPSAAEVRAKWLLHNDACEGAFIWWTVQTALSELADDDGKQLGRGGQVEDAIAARAQFGLEVREPIGQCAEALGITEPTGLVVQCCAETLPFLFGHGRVS